MIVDRLENAATYYALSEDIRFTLEYLKAHRKELAEAPCGITQISENVQMKILEYESVPTDRHWEAHVENIDVQYVISGSEAVGYTCIADLHDPVKVEGKDQYLYQGKGNKVPLPEGYFMILFPQDAHSSKLAWQEVCQIKKASFKLRIH